ncbi:MAG: tRNA (guanosine(46)-N7)-methyltransferase TrmB [Oscillospiraceae bacterium]|nr:tRNA (guanosine(46)-N7)-methyltransferase TrmB [Oscillospiraceae bacterium]
MRMRARNNLESRLEACAGFMTDAAGAAELPGPLHIEIGCGKGRFITETAALHPEISYVAVEKVSNVIVLAMEKAKAAELSNLKFIRGDFAMIAPQLPEGSVDRIYLNFSDPWPKNGYAKRRLTHGAFLEQYKRILKDGGEIHFKTDNRGLFDFSLETFPENGFELKNITFDLHKEMPDGNIMTEYEQRFSEIGTPICRLEATVRK